MGGAFVAVAGTAVMTEGAFSVFTLAVVVPLAAVLIRGMLMVLGVGVGRVLMIEGGGVLMAEGLFTLMGGVAGL